MTCHDLKILPQFFQAVVDGRKTFELRREDDRMFHIGDTLTLCEWRPGSGHTGRQCKVEVVYILLHEDFADGIPEGYAVLSIRVVGRMAKGVRI